MHSKLNFLKTKRGYFTVGLLLGVLTVLAIRFVTYSVPPPVHYHANFAVYINGEREVFKNPKYYQEVAVCGLGDGLPEQRGHLHDDVNDAIHIHDNAVTWGQFFNNLGWNIGADYIVTDDNTLYREDGDKKLYIYINEKDYTDLTSLTNTVIQDKDRLLVSYGKLDAATLEAQAKSVAKTAEEYNNKPDPSACAGNKKTTLKDRLKNLF